MVQKEPIYKDNILGKNKPRQFYNHYYIYLWIILHICLFDIQSLKKQRYRFSLIVNELRMAELTPYKITILAFVNCILVATDSLDDRICIRNEFIGNYTTIYVYIGSQVS